MTAAEPDGFVCLVLPQVFLTATNAASLRLSIACDFDVRCLVDVSAVPVFENIGAYNILLVLQRRAGSVGTQRPSALIAQISAFIGPALQACLEGRLVENRHYRVFSVEQDFFASKEWVLVGPSQLKFDMRLRRLPKLSTFLDVRQGLVSGADDVFMRDRSDVPEGEELSGESTCLTGKSDDIAFRRAWTPLYSIRSRADVP